MEAPGGLRMGILIPSVSAEIFKKLRTSTLGDLGLEFRTLILACQLQRFHQAFETTPRQ